MNVSLQDFINQRLSAPKAKYTGVGGGSINDSFRIESDNLKFFCKINSAEKFPGLFEKEKNGLEFLSRTKSIRVPEVVWCGTFEDQQILILEWIEQGLRTEAFWKKFGERLAALHSSDRDGPTMHGYHENNYMGALPQDNTQSNNWVEFFITRRLKPQIALACNNRLLTHKEVDLFEQLYMRLDSIFPMEQPATLHGDLWSGNYLCGRNSEPVLIDPAVYYGHRSMDLGMTKLFGGFDQAFYEAYDYHFPLPMNADEQSDICNLYPLLIHLNLFGSGYLSSIREILKRFA